MKITWAQMKGVWELVAEALRNATEAAAAAYDETAQLRPIEWAWACAWGSALQMIGVQSQLIGFKSSPNSFHAAILAILFSFTSILLSKCTNSKLPRVVIPLLEQLGVFFAITAFFIGITISLPLSLVVFTWLLYGLSFLAIILSYSLF